MGVGLWDMFKLWRVFGYISKKIKEDAIMKEKLKSRKLWVTVFTAALAVFNSQLQLVPPDTMDWLFKLIMGYIGGQTVVDAAKALKNNDSA